MKHQELIQECVKIVAAEKSLTLEVIRVLAKIDSRKAYLEMGYGSLFDFVTTYLGYEESAAQRRIQAARLIQELPEVEKKIEDGSLKLSLVSQTQTMFNKERRRRGKAMDKSEKRCVLKKLEGKSSRESQKVLAVEFPEVAKESVKPKANGTELKLLVSDELLDKMQRLKHLLSHQNPGMNYSELLEILCDQAIEKHEPKKPEEMGKRRNAKPNTDVSKSAQSPTTDEDGTPSKLTRHIPNSIKRFVFHRDQGECTFRAEDGTKCTSKHLLQYDHILPFARGGLHNAENLRLLCHAHHRGRD